MKYKILYEARKKDYAEQSSGQDAHLRAFTEVLLAYCENEVMPFTEDAYYDVIELIE